MKINIKSLVKNHKFYLCAWLFTTMLLLGACVYIYGLKRELDTVTIQRNKLSDVIRMGMDNSYMTEVTLRKCLVEEEISIDDLMQWSYEY